MASKSNWTDEEREEITRWIALAIIDRRGAAHMVEANLFGLSVYHIQQASEKLLKAFLLAHRVKIEKTHDIQKLLLMAIPLDPTLIAVNNIGVGSAKMTDFATEYRYPNPKGNDLGDLDEVKGGLEYTDALYAHLRPFFGNNIINDALLYTNTEKNPFEDSSIGIVDEVINFLSDKGKEGDVQKP